MSKIQAVEFRDYVRIKTSPNSERYSVLDRGRADHASMTMTETERGIHVTDARDDSSALFPWSIVKCVIFERKSKATP